VVALNFGRREAKGTKGMGKTAAILVTIKAFRFAASELLGKREGDFLVARSET
jgi:hypothetical protein